MNRFFDIQPLSVIRLQDSNPAPGSVFGGHLTQIAEAVNLYAQSIEKIVKASTGKGSGAYELGQCSAALQRLEHGVVPNLRQAISALNDSDGWKALRVLDEAEHQLVEAQELVAPSPSSRHYARLVLDPLHKCLVLFGGDGEDRYFADTWLFHLETRRWERLHLKIHPPYVGTSGVAMDYYAENKVIVLAHQSDGFWTFDVGKRAWKKYELSGEFARQGKGSTWLRIEYAPEARLHILIDTLPTAPARRTQLLHLNLISAKESATLPDQPEETWRPMYGGGISAQGNIYDQAWNCLPRSQAEYRQAVNAHKQTLNAIPDNTWTQFKNTYSAIGRAYGSFCYDRDHNEIHLWGGGHSAYMGNQWSQYSLDSNLWMES